MCNFCGIIPSLTCAGVAVPSAVERKELLQFPVVKEVPSEFH